MPPRDDAGSPADPAAPRADHHTADPQGTDPVARTIDATAASTNAAIGRAANAGAELVDKAAGAAKGVERTVRSGGRAALDVGQDAVRAGLGVAGAVGDQAGRLLSALVDRGAQLEHRVVEQVRSTAKDASEAVRTRVGDVRHAVDARAEAAATRVGDVVEDTVAGPLGEALRRLGVPTRAEMQALTASIAALTAKVDALVARLDANAGVTPGGQHAGHTADEAAYASERARL